MENVIEFQKREKVISSKLNFIKMASHEFRSPLSTIVSSIDLLDKYQQNNDRSNATKHIQRLKNTVEGMRNMLEYFTALNFSGDTKSTGECLHCDRLHEIMDQSIEDAKEGLKNGQIIKLAFGGVAPVFVNKYYLVSICKNLISNAVKYSDTNQIIKIKLQIDENHIVLTVEDRGIGISESDQICLKKKYFSGTASTFVPGSGLGLYIVSRHLELLDGTLEIKSKISKGSKFIVTIPNKL